MKLAAMSAVLVVGSLALLGAAQREAMAQKARKAGWHSAYESARAAALESGKPLLVVFRCEP